MKIFEYGKDDVESLFESLQRRTPEGKRDVEEKVSEILRNVRERGNQAIYEYTQKFDGVSVPIHDLEVSKKEMEKALSDMDKELIETIERAAANIRAYHERQRRTPGS